MPLDSLLLGTGTGWSAEYKGALGTLKAALDIGTINPYLDPDVKVGGPLAVTNYPVPDFNSINSEIATHFNNIDFLEPDADWNTVLHSILTNLTGTNPDYPTTYFSPTAPDDLASTMNTVLANALKSAYKTAISATVGADEYDSLTASALDKSGEALTDANTTSSGNLATMYGLLGSIKTPAKEIADLYIPEAITDADAQREANLSSGDLINDRSDAETATGAVSVNARTDLLIILDAFVADLNTKIPTMLEQALSTAQTLVASTPIDNLVDAFETKSLPEHLRSVNRLSAGMADINAVNSSAFILGMTMLESDRTQVIADYRAKLVADIFPKVFEMFSGVFTTIVSQTLSAYTAQFAERMQMTRYVSDKRVGTFLQVFDSYIKTALTTLAEISQTHRVNVPSQTQIYQSMLVSGLETLKSAMMTHVNTYIGERVQQKSLQNSMFQGGISDVLQSRLNKFLLQKDAMAFDTELNRVQHVAYNEAWNMQERYATEGKIWPWKKWQYMANAVAAAGSGVMVPDKPNPWTSMLGGAISLGLAGASVAKDSNAPGWGVGAAGLAGAVLGGWAGDTSARWGG
uniref:Uncharacterized protein n=1 Tax=viral metagenome TaxID=1070528 RepID=A0A6M3KQK0_9ZZZZ